jgi:DNA-binding GntR family transcriptional regulator
MRNESPARGILESFASLRRIVVYSFLAVPPAPKSHVVPRASLSDVVYERLRDEIMQGEIADGSRLSQVQLAERYGVSRIPIREALRRLQSESLVVAMPYHPFVVRNITPEQVVELVDVRAALEDLALTRRALPTAEEVAELRAITQQMTKARGEDWFGLDRRFHALLSGPSTMIVEIINDVRDRVHKYSASMVAAKPGRTTANQEHAGIVDALEAGDLERARRLLNEHVAQSRAFMVKRLGADV